MSKIKKSVITTTTDIIGISALTLTAVSGIGLISSALFGIIGIAETISIVNFAYFMAGSALTTVSCDLIQLKTQKGNLAKIIHSHTASQEIYHNSDKVKTIYKPNPHLQQEPKEALLQMLQDLSTASESGSKANLSRIKSQITIYIKNPEIKNTIEALKIQELLKQETFQSDELDHLKREIEDMTKQVSGTR